MKKNNHIDFSIEKQISETSSEVDFIVEKMKKNNHIERSKDAKSEAFFEVDLIVRNMKKNNHIEFSIEKHDSIENELIDDDFFDVNDFEHIMNRV